MDSYLESFFCDWNSLQLRQHFDDADHINDLKHGYKKLVPRQELWSGYEFLNLGGQELIF
jgi:hypothetical protein